MSPNDRDPRDHAPASRDLSEKPGTLGPRLPQKHPPTGLEQRVVASLAARGLLEPTSLSSARWRGWRVLGMLAAAAALFVAGGLAERVRADAGPEEEADVAVGETPRFALLLYGGPASTSADEEEALVAEYGGWARDLASRGRYVTGEKLGEIATTLGAGAGAGTNVGAEPRSIASGSGDVAGPVVGFFIIGARSAEEAEEIARTIPHLRHGGRVVVRPIDPT